MKIQLSDGNATEMYDTIAEAASAASEWYDYMADDQDSPMDYAKLKECRTPAEVLPEPQDAEGLNRWIAAYEDAIAAALGKSDFAGHGNYFVAARDEVRRHAVDAGREPESVDMVLSGGWNPEPQSGPHDTRTPFTGPAEAVVCDLEEWEDAGVGTMIVRFPTTDPDEISERLAEFAETAMPTRSR